MIEAERDAMSMLDDLQDLLPRPYWAPASYPRLCVPRPSSPLSSDSRWIQSMAAAASSGPPSRSFSIQMHVPRSQRGGDLLGHRRSASPVRSSSHSATSLLPQQARFVDKLQRMGQEFVIIDPLWTSKKLLAWNEDFIEVGYMLIGDEGAQAHLRYWASCSPDCLSLSDLLYKAIRWGLPFKVGVKVEDFRRFKPEDVSNTDRMVGKPSSAVEPPFAYTAQGTLKAYYMSHVNDINHCPHAWILVGMGGPEAWLARKWGGSWKVHPLTSIFTTMATSTLTTNTPCSSTQTR